MTRNELAAALMEGTSLRHAAELLGVTVAVLRKRAEKDPALYPLLCACVTRGNELKSSVVRDRRRS